MTLETQELTPLLCRKGKHVQLILRKLPMKAEIFPSCSEIYRKQSASHQPWEVAHSASMRLPWRLVPVLATYTVS